MPSNLAAIAIDSNWLSYLIIMIAPQSLGNKVASAKHETLQSSGKEPDLNNIRLNSQANGKDSGNPLVVHIDYMSLVIGVSNFQDLTDVASQLSKDGGLYSLKEIGTKDIGDNQMETTYTISSVCGFQGKATINNVKGGKFYFSLTGIWWEEFNLIDQWRWCNYFNSSGCRVTRIDLAVDDYTGKVIPFYQMREATEKGNYCRFKSHKTYRSRSDYGNEYLETDYYGSRQSESMVRCYQKQIEDKKIIRFEGELKRKKAENAMSCIVALERDRAAYMKAETDQEREEIDNQFKKDLSQIMAGIAVGCIDFRDRTKGGDRKEKNLDRCERLPFWEKFLNDIKAWIRVPGTQVVRTVEKTIRWVKRQVSGTLEAIKQGIGCRQYYEWMMEMMTEKGENLSKYQELLADTLKVNPDLVKVHGT